MKYAYEKLMEDNDLTLSELPSDARHGINQLKKIEKSIKMVQGRGKSVSNDIMEQIRVNDKWIVREILDYIEDKDIDRGELPNSAEDVIEDLHEETSDDTTQPDTIGLKVDKELKSLFEAGKTLLTGEEIRDNARNTFEVIFDTYAKDGENGVVTTYYALIENAEGNFILTKK